MTDVQMDYGMMEDMRSTFQNGVQTIESTLSAVEGIAGELEDGSLLGRAGDALADAVRNVLSQRIQRLQEKFEELVQDIDGSIQEFQESDQSAAGGFGD